MQRFARSALNAGRGISMVAKTANFHGRTLRFMATVRFAESHEYVSLDGDVATIGITGHAADALGDIVYIDLPEVGKEYDEGETFGAVESVKAASDVYSPVNGEVVEVNTNLEETPGLVNESPMEQGWFMKLKLSDKGKEQFENLMNEDSYKSHIDN